MVKFFAKVIIVFVRQASLFIFTISKQKINYVLIPNRLPIDFLLWLSNLPDKFSLYSSILQPFRKNVFLFLKSKPPKILKTLSCIRNNKKIFFNFDKVIAISVRLTKLCSMTLSYILLKYFSSTAKKNCWQNISNRQNGVKINKMFHTRKQS